MCWATSQSTHRNRKSRCWRHRARRTLPSTQTTLISQTEGADQARHIGPEGARKAASASCSLLTMQVGRTNRLGEFLRAKRAAITPRELGIPDIGRRRVPGLRREEVAHLAGISADYYLRLERGRDRHPSIQVLVAIARALQFDDDTTAYLLSLISLPSSADSRSRPAFEPKSPPRGVLQLLTTLSHPAFVEDRCFDIRAANPMAAMLSPRLIPGRNQLRDIFLEPAEISLHEDWECITECLAASLRHSMGASLDDPCLTELVAELWAHSSRFRDLWPRHEIRVQGETQIAFLHPTIGRVLLHRERLTIGAADAHIVIYHAEPGTPESNKLALLARLIND